MSALTTCNKGSHADRSGREEARPRELEEEVDGEPGERHAGGTLRQPPAPMPKEPKPKRQRLRYYKPKNFAAMPVKISKAPAPAPSPPTQAAEACNDTVITIQIDHRNKDLKATSATC
eukprot:1409-Hanusia_phi.AAC.1